MEHYYRGLHHRPGESGRMEGRSLFFGVRGGLGLKLIFMIGVASHSGS